MNTKKLKKIIIKALPYVLMGLVCTNLGEAWRLAEGADASKKLLSFFSTLGTAFSNPLPSFHPVDLLVFSARWGQPSAILSRAFIPWISWSVPSAEALCTLLFISAIRMPSTSNTTKNTDPPGGAPMLISSPSWIPSLRTT